MMYVRLHFLGHIQIAQVPGRHEPLSSGELDYNFIFQVIRDIKYANWIGCEYIPHGKCSTQFVAMNTSFYLYI